MRSEGLVAGGEAYRGVQAEQGIAIATGADRRRGAALRGGFRSACFWLERLLHFFAEAAARAEQTQAHGDDGNRKALGDFLRRVVHNIAQQAGLAQVGGKLEDRVGEHAAHFAAGALLFRICGFCFEQSRERFFGVAAWFLEREMPAVATLAQCVNGSVTGDAREPGAKVVGVVIAVSGKLIEARPRLEERFLADVFGVGDIPGDAAGALKQRRHVGRDDFGKGFAIAAAGARDESRARTRLQESEFGCEGDGCSAHDSTAGGRRSAMLHHGLSACKEVT